MIDPIPVSRFLVPDRPPALSEGFTLVTTAVQAGLPCAIPIEHSTRLLLVAPTGLATMWRDMNPSTVVSRSDDEVLPFDPASATDPPGEASFVPLRLLLQAGNETLGVMPLRAGISRLLPDRGMPESGVRFEVVVLSWILTSGSVRGAGDFGSRIAIAWRRADRATEHFSTPPPHPVLVKRLPPAHTMQSLVGYDLRIARVLDPHLRYRRKKVFAR